MKFLKAWAKLNRSTLIVAGLIALALLVGLAAWSRLRRRGTATPKAAKTSRKASGKSVSEKVQGRPVIEEAPFTANRVAASPVASAPKPRQEAWVPQPARAGLGTAAVHEQREADKDREVFEL